MNCDSANRFIDLHSHLIPGVDDGCRDVAESLACIRRLEQAGFVGSVCTPHVWPDLYPANAPGTIGTWIQELHVEAQRAGMKYQLWPGGEVRIANALIGWFERHGVPTLGASRCVLCDFWGRDWPRFADDLVDWLLEHAYQPVLAHPERMGLANADMLRLADSLVLRGAWLQGNLRSLAGGEGPAAEEQLKLLLDQGYVYVLATDTHRPADIGGRLSGIDALEKLHGRDAVHTFLAARPAEMLQDRR
jgi:protein-tyrosine phosphatase